MKSNNDVAMLNMIKMSDGVLLADATPQQVQDEIDMHLEQVRILRGLLQCVDFDSPSMSEGFARARAEALLETENLRNTLKGKFVDAADRRQLLSSQDPDDVRLSASVSTLKTLVGTTELVDSVSLDALLALFNEDDNKIANEMLEQSIIQIGLTADYKDAESFVCGLVESLTPIIESRKDDRFRSLLAAQEAA